MQHHMQKCHRDVTLWNIGKSLICLSNLQRKFAKGNIYDYKGWLKSQVQTFFGIMEVTSENKIVDMSKGNAFFTL